MIETYEGGRHCGAVCFADAPICCNCSICA